MTQSLHDQLEAETLPKKLYAMKITEQEYMQYMLIFFRIHHDIEEELLKFSQWSEFGINIESYMRLELIKKDLKVMGIEFILDSCNDIELESFEKALGYLYVLTGSTMGGMILSQKVTQTFEESPYKTANSYFNAFGEDTKMMFFSFMQFLENYVQKLSTQKQDEIVQGAKDCYKFVQKCMQNG